MTTEQERVVSCLRKDWTLTNRGSGWWLAEPTIPYKRAHSELVEDEVVDELEKSGVLKLELPYNSVKATLVDS